MTRIAQCESGGTQFTANGTVVESKTHDVGLFQINLHAHLNEAKAMGLDIINSAADNTAYAIHLYALHGTADWSMSKPCWGKYDTDGT